MQTPDAIQGLLQLAPDALIVVDADNSILAVNDRLVNLFGYSRADLDGLPLEFLLPAAAEALQLLRSQGEPLPEQDFWVQDANGNTLAVGVTLASMPGNRACLALRDATPRKKAEQLLDEARIRSEQRLSDQLLLSNTLPLAIFQWQSDNGSAVKCTFLSTRVQDLLGVAAERIVAHPQLLFATLHTDDARMLMEQISEVRAQVARGSPKAAFSVTVRAQVNGQQRWLRIAAVYAGIRVDGRNIWNGYLEDITRRKKAEEDRERATAQFKNLWEKSPDTYMFVGQNGVMSCNASALDLFGMDSADMLIGHAITDPRFSPERQDDGQNSAALFEDILHYASTLARNPDQPPAAAPAGTALRPVHGSVRFEWQFLRHASQPFFAEVAVTPMQIDAHDGYLLTCWDISLQRQAKTELINAKLAAEDMSRTKADFLANMSHEIRTPMNAIVGLSHLVLQSDLNRTQRDFLRKIQDSGQHLLGIINDILDFSKMEAGKLSIEERDFRLSRVLENVANLIEDKVKSKEGLQLVFDIAPDVPDLLHGDALRLGQILINYANNAVKFTESGEIRVAANVIPSAPGRIGLRFAVHDTGIGLSEEQIQRLFQSFQQADGSTTRKYGGTGLGLAICKNLAELMHGEVGVESALGHGSTFWFTVQLEPGHGAQRPDEAGSAQDSLGTGGTSLTQQLAGIAGARVLLVEDNELNQLVASELLGGAGLVVDILDNGRLAVDSILRTPTRWDLVLMDMQMPVLDGVSATWEVRRALGTEQPIIVAMTANAMPQHRKICLEAGMQDFITKPIEPEQLWATLLRWIVPRPRHNLPPIRLSDPPAATDTAAAKLPQGIDGLDTAQGLRRVLGNSASYLAMLRSFVQRQAAAVDRVRQALAQQDWMTAEREAHTLKGVAGNLGAGQVQTDAGALESGLAQRLSMEQLAPLLQAAQRSLDYLVGALQSQLPDVSMQPASEVDMERLPELVERLKTLLRNDDSAALDLFGDNAALLKCAFPANYATLEAALTGYDFAQALEQL